MGNRIPTKRMVVHGDHRSVLVSTCIWVGMLLLFLILEIAGLIHRWVPAIPWFTASETDWEGVKLLPDWARWLVRILLIGFFTSLGIHFGFGTTLLP